MKTLNTIALQKKQAEVDSADFSPKMVKSIEDRHDTFPHSVGKVPDQLHSLVEVVKLYRRQEQAYFEKIKRKEFAKDELHFMKKPQEKLDRLLTTINL